MKRIAYVVDIDGTLADNKHRLHLIADKSQPQWDAFFDACTHDKPIVDVIQLLQRVYSGEQRQDRPGHFFYVTGRPERVRTVTAQWLSFHNCPNGVLVMRTNGDHRPDTVVKREAVEMVMEQYQVAGVFEDRPAVCRTWREMGLTVFQVGSGEEF